MIKLNPRKIPTIIKQRARIAAAKMDGITICEKTGARIHYWPGRGGGFYAYPWHPSFDKFGAAPSIGPASDWVEKGTV